MAKKGTVIRFNKKSLNELPVPKGNSRPVYHDDLVNGLLLII